MAFPASWTAETHWEKEISPTPHHVCATADRWGGDALQVPFGITKSARSVCRQKIRDELIGPKTIFESGQSSTCNRLSWATPALLECKSCSDRSQSAGSGLMRINRRPPAITYCNPSWPVTYSLDDACATQLWNRSLSSIAMTRVEITSSPSQGPASEMNTVEKDALLQPICRRLAYHDSASSSRRRYPCTTLGDLSNDRGHRGIIAAGIRYRACHVTTVCVLGPHLREPNPTSLQSASALSLRQFGPVSIEAFIAVLVILDPDTVESYPGPTMLPRRRSYAQSHAKLTSQLAYSCSILPCIGPYIWTRNRDQAYITTVFTNRRLSIQWLD
jgi:hypothetical protein